MEFPHSRFESFLLRVALFTCFVINLSCTAESKSPLRSNETDRLALLALKDQISTNPNGFMDSWNDSIHFCMWSGVVCSRRHPQRVIALNMEGQSLVGIVSPHIGNLSFLRSIDLSNNSFHGQIPQELSRLFRLQFLDLHSNSFRGEISKNLTHCSKLTFLSLYENGLGGEIPFEIGSLLKLNFLYLGENNLTGYIPPSLGNLSSLIRLYLSNNRLEGSIPHNLGRLMNLTHLGVAANKFSGMFPPVIYNLSSITVLSVELNSFQGTLLPELGLLLPKLELFYAGDNKLTGAIPDSLVNASMIEELDLSSNKFTGSVPLNIGMLQKLNFFNVEYNQLGGERDDDFNFITSLTNCSGLQQLIASQNQFSGVLPNSIANLSIHLWNLALSDNLITGTIPGGIENLVGLSALYLSNNLLNGNIPINLGKLSNLEIVFLHGNKLFGQIPTSLGNLTRLYKLLLVGNSLKGRVPPALGNCRQLQKLSLSSNNLDGTIPIEVLSIPFIIEIYLDSNSFVGPLKVLGSKQIQSLDISNNKLSGEIPSSLGSCVSLEYLYLEDNFFQGSIPPSLVALRGLEELDLSRNNFSGQIPKFLGQLPFLKYLNLSFNKLEGEVPTNGVFQNSSQISIVANDRLCGGIPELQLPTCPKQEVSKKQGRDLSVRIVISTIVAVFFLSLLLCFSTKRYWLKKTNIKATSTSTMKEFFPEISYAELVKATDGFSSANLIGVGSYGSVYRGFVDRIERAVAVKVFDLQERRRASKSFLAECKALRSIQHRNIVKVLTVCSSIDFRGNDFKALVYEYMPNGNLDKWIHPKDSEHGQLRNLNFIPRLNVAIDVASALDYLHNHSQEPVVHCDLKPSNVLLDDDMVAHVGDFGLARIILPENIKNISRAQTSSSIVKGSIGYIPPEYGVGGDVSTYGDVYSFGILLLELFIGKRPTDDMFGVDLSFRQYAKMMLPERVMEIIDHRLLSEETESEINGYNEDYSRIQSRMQDCLVSLVEMGISCSAESSNERMEISDVVKEMQGVRDFYIGVKNYAAMHTRASFIAEEGPSYLSNY